MFKFNRNNTNTTPLEQLVQELHKRQDHLEATAFQAERQLEVVSQRIEEGKALLQAVIRLELPVSRRFAYRRIRQQLDRNENKASVLAAKARECRAAAGDYRSEIQKITGSTM